jgi:protein-tyrosine phosphatase
LKKSGVKKICGVFVCTGNTCRSPVAERVFKAMLKAEKKASRFRVLSAGLGAFDGDGMSALSMEVLKDEGLPHLGHKARFLSERLVKNADFLICMTESHKTALQGYRHAHVHTVAEITGGTDVTDPYGGTYQEYRHMLDALQYAAPEILAFIERELIHP